MLDDLDCFNLMMLGFAIPLARRMRLNVQDGEDAVQEMHHRLQQGLFEFQGPGSRERWGRTVIRHYLLYLLAQRRRGPVGELLPAMEVSSPADPAPRLAAAIMCLSPIHKRYFELRYRDERSKEYTAQTLDSEFPGAPEGPFTTTSKASESGRQPSKHYWNFEKVAKEALEKILEDIP